LAEVEGLDLQSFEIHFLPIVTGTEVVSAKMGAVSYMSQSKNQYGSWPSPLSAARVTAGALRLDQIQLDGDDVYWIEGRASEGGRSVIVKRSPLRAERFGVQAEYEITDVTPPGFNVRSRVHEYGGGAYTVDAGTIYFSNFPDQRIYRQQPGKAPVAITDEGAFFADYRVDRFRNRLIAVRETHVPGSEAKNDLVAIGIPTGVPDQVLVEGADFYSDPIVSPDGKFLAWLQWHHPNMPWDGTELWVAVFNPDGSVGSREKIAGGASESIFQPEWSPDSSLYFVSDRTGWWNLYRWSPSTALSASGPTDEPVHQMEAEFGKPQWTFSMVTYAIVDANRIAVTYAEGGRWKLAMIDVAAKVFTPIDLRIEPLESIKAAVNPRAAEGLENTDVYFLGGSPTQPTAVVVYSTNTRRISTIRSSATELIPREWISVAEAVTFKAGNREVHAFYYGPKNPDVEAGGAGEAGGEGRAGKEIPPLLVITHGGPTGATTDVLDPKIQFWTSRGFAVLDVNYSGSTGYGRPYRERLRTQWGIVDVEDVVAGAKAMVEAGKADPERLIIRGGSAGGYTTLAALTFHDTFKSGASYYGISDLEVLQQDTHKFESRYNDSLIGPYPEAKDIYKARSPIHFTDRLDRPIILFQGLEDKVVPPNQSEMMADAVRKKGLKVKYVTFEGEQHGFRKAENIIRSLEEELAFYRDVFSM
jgi:dipeptidyl aminopeptidase/acylaminoacyl peptidase